MSEPPTTSATELFCPTGRSSVAKALGTTELLAEILGYILRRGPTRPHPPISIAPLLVCKRWCEIGTDFLWKDISLVNLVRVLPTQWRNNQDGDTEWAFADDSVIHPSAFERVMYYASKVSALRISARISDELALMLSNHLPGDCFPRLQLIEWIDPRYFGQDSRTDPVAWHLLLYLHRAPRLTSLYLDVAREDTSLPRALSYLSGGSLANLEEFSLIARGQGNLSATVLQAVYHILDDYPSLKHVGLTVESVDELLTLADKMNKLSALLSCSLTASLPELQSVVSLLSLIKYPQLQVLHLGECESESLQGELGFHQLFGPLLHLKCLRQLELEFPELTVTLELEDVRSMASAWPEMEKLELTDLNIQTAAVPTALGLPLNWLSVFAQCFGPTLHTLGLALDLNWHDATDTDTPTVGAYFKGLRVLDLTGSHFDPDTIPRVAEYLVPLCMEAEIHFVAGSIFEAPDGDWKLLGDFISMGRRLCRKMENLQVNLHSKEASGS